MFRKAILMILALFTFAGGALGQSDSDACFSTGYAALAKPSTLSEGINHADALDDLIFSCKQRVGQDSIGLGTFDSPFKYGEFAPAGNGLTIKVSGFNSNPVSPHRYRRAERGHVFVHLKLDVRCEYAESNFCPELDQYYIDLIGDNGKRYGYQSQTYKDEYELRDLVLREGSEGIGTLLYEVEEDDANFMLIYQPSTYNDDTMIIYSALPSLYDAVNVTAVRNLNVRSGPGINYGVKAGLQSGEATMAIGRNNNSTWVETTIGWVYASLLSISKPLDTLPVTSP